MKTLFAILVLTMGLSVPAAADVWKWVDASGKTHFVDTMKPIYTWLDEFGKRHYADTPGCSDNGWSRRTRIPPRASMRSPAPASGNCSSRAASDFTKSRRQRPEAAPASANL